MKRQNLTRTLVWGMWLTIAASCTSKTGTQPFRILTGGIAHESNTFNPLLTTEDYFVIKRGEEAMDDELWATYLQEAGTVVIPTLHVNANPFGVVEKRTFDEFKEEILTGARQAGTVDGVFLDMHGALHVEGYEDAQVDFVRQLREIVGEEALIAASFDLHGNISKELISELDLMTAYRTAPHVDGPETRLRAVTLLLDALKNNHQPVIAHVKVPILIPGEKGITSTEPLKSLYDQLPSIAEKEGLLDASIFVGMPWTDVPRAGMSLQVVAEDASHFKSAQAEVHRLVTELWEQRLDLKFDVEVDSLQGAVKTALESTEATVFITDSGDNTTAGAAGDNTGVLDYLMSQGITNTVIAGIVDPDAVAACEQAGLGAEVSLVIGGKLDTQFGAPLPIKGTVQFVTLEIDSEFPRRRPVVLESDGITIVLLNEVRSFTTVKDFEDVRINPLGYKIVVVKLGYLFPELRQIAPKAIMALTPGFANQVLENLPYQHVVRPIYPLDPDMGWSVKLRKR